MRHQCRLKKARKTACAAYLKWIEQEGTLVLWC